MDQGARVKAQDASRMHPETCAAKRTPRRERLEARQVALHVRLVVAHEARAGHGAPHDGLERVRQAALLAFLLLRARRIHVQPHACAHGRHSG